uniref:C2H2-type domain-containing protein n=1 Tax=Oryza brachyantha TaxID=4533 RepID=J3MME6_ORYBR
MSTSQLAIVVAYRALLPVYVCPEPNCVHHAPTRALGDLTGIKKHFCRKHGEKRWACQRCGKRYAVQADLKAHSKTCGTREYRCDCGTLFTRRDSFVTHRAFCGALVEETGRVLAVPAPPSPRPPELEAEENADKDKEEEEKKELEENEDSPVAEVDESPHSQPVVEAPQQCAPSPPPPILQEHQQPVVAVVPNADEQEVVAETTVIAKQEVEDDRGEDTCFHEVDRFKDAELEDSNLLDNDTPMLPCFLPSPSEAIGTDGSSTSCGTGSSVTNSIAPATTTSTFAGLFASVTTSSTPQSRSLRDLIGVDPTFLCLAIGAPSSLFPQTNASDPCSFAPPPAPHMSATALLQKAAEVGASQSSSSFLKEFGLAPSTSSSPPSKLSQGRFTGNTTPSQPPQGRFMDNAPPTKLPHRMFTDNSVQQWHHRSNQQMEMEPGPMLSGGLGLGLTYDSGNSVLPDLMMGPSTLYGPKPATLDFLGLGIGGTMGGSTANGGLPALMVGGELDMGSAQAPAPWEEAKRKTNGHTIL